MPWPAADEIRAIPGSSFEIDRQLGRNMSAVLHEASVPGYLRTSVLSTTAHRPCRRLQRTSKAVIASSAANAKG